MSVEEHAAPRLRVGLNAHLLAPGGSYRGAGVSHYIEQLLRHLPEVDGGIDYVSYVGDRRLTYGGWRSRSSLWRTASPMARIAWEQSVLPWAARRERLDLLHAPVYVAPLVKTCPYVVSVHDLSFYLFPECFRPYNRVYLQRMTRHSVAHAEKVITGSCATRDDLVRLLDVPPEHIVVIPDGVDDQMRPIAATEVEAFRAKRQLPDHFILYLGTLEPRKNIVGLVEAYAQLQSRSHTDHQLILAGAPGWYYESIYQAVERLGLASRVVFPGYIPQEEIALWYNAADLFVFPSLYEGFGLPPLEAMACGTPTVVANRPSLPEVVGNAAIIVEPDDPDAIADAMVAVLGDVERSSALAAAGRERASHFSWTQTAIHTAKLYRQIVGEAK